MSEVAEPYIHPFTCAICKAGTPLDDVVIAGKSEITKRKCICYYCFRHETNAGKPMTDTYMLGVIGG